MRSRVFRRWIAAVLTLLLGVGLAGVVGSARAAVQGRSALQVAAPPPVASAAGQFYASRGRVATALKIAKGATATLDVTGVAGVPASGVASVALNIAVRGETAGPGQLIVYPSGAAVPSGTTAIRYRTTIYAQNLLTAKVGSDGNLRVFNDGPVPAIVYADVHGYTLTAAGAGAGSTFVPLKPARIALGASIPANGSYTLSPLGQGGIPVTGVSHAVFTFNVKSADTGKLTVYPSGTARPADTNLDYGLGLWMQNHVFARLGADGRVVISNIGAKAVLFDLHVSGYFATPQAAAAGSTFQPLQPARLVNFQLVGPDEAYTFTPLGVGGVPASGVSSVAVAITARGVGTLPANLRVYPSGTGSTPTHSVAVHTNAQIYSGFITAKLGLDGRVTILNNGPEGTRIWVDVFGFFRLPVSCGLSAAGRVGVVAVEQNSRTAVVQASLAPGEGVRALEYAYVDNIGQLVQGHQPLPDNYGSVQWTVISGSVEAFTGQPGLIEQLDGRLHVVGHNTSGNVWANTQATKDPPVWGSWVNVPQAMASHAAVGRQGDTLVTFAVDAAGSLWALPQHDPNGAYGSWVNLGSTGLIGTPVVAEVRDGVQVFALDSAGTWRTALYSRGVLTRCASLGGSGFTGTAAVVAYPGNKLRVIARAADGSVQTKVQDDTGGFPVAWDTVGTFTAAGSPSALLSPAGKTEIVVRGTDGRIWSTGETAQGTGLWRNWVKAQADHDTFMPVTDPVAFNIVGGSAPWAFVVRDNDQLNRVYDAPSAVTARAAETPPEFTPRPLPAPPGTNRG